MTDATKPRTLDAEVVYVPPEDDLATLLRKSADAVDDIHAQEAKREVPRAVSHFLTSWDEQGYAAVLVVE